MATAAQRKLAEHDRIRVVLSGAAADVLLAAVEVSPAPTDKLIAALRRHRDLFG
jgi:hypothetical protein